MRILKIALAAVVTVLAMMFSLVVALGVALVGLLAYLYLRLRRPPAADPLRHPSRPASPAAGPDVIEVSATEVREPRLDK